MTTARVSQGWMTGTYSTKGGAYWEVYVQCHVLHKWHYYIVTVPAVTYLVNTQHRNLSLGQITHLTLSL